MSSSKTFKPFGLFYSLITRFKRHKDSAQQQTVDLLSTCVNDPIGTRDRRQQVNSSNKLVNIGVETIFEEMGLNYATEMVEEIRDLITAPDEDGVDVSSESVVEDEEEDREILMEDDQIQEDDPEEAAPPSDLRENATASPDPNNASMMEMFINDNTSHDHQYGHRQQARDGDDMMEQPQRQSQGDIVDEVDEGNLADDEDSLLKSPVPLCIDLSAFDLNDILGDGQQSGQEDVDMTDLQNNVPNNSGLRDINNLFRSSSVNSNSVHSTTSEEIEVHQLTSSQVEHLTDDAIVRELLRQSGALSPFDFVGFPSPPRGGGGGQGSQDQTSSPMVGPTERQRTPHVSLLVQYELTDDEDDEEEDLMDTTSSGTESQTPKSSSYEGGDEESDLEKDDTERSSSSSPAASEPSSDEYFFSMAQAYLDRKVAERVIEDEEEEDVPEKEILDNDNEYLQKQKNDEKDETFLEVSEKKDEKDEQPLEVLLRSDEVCLGEVHLDKNVFEKVNEEEEYCHVKEVPAKVDVADKVDQKEDSKDSEQQQLPSEVLRSEEEGLILSRAVNLDSKVLEKEEEEEVSAKHVATDKEDEYPKQKDNETKFEFFEKKEEMNGEQPSKVLRSDKESCLLMTEDLDKQVPEKMKEEEVLEKDILKNSQKKYSQEKYSHEKEVIIVEDSDSEEEEDFPAANSIPSKKMKFTTSENDVPIFSTAPLTEQSIEGLSVTVPSSSSSSLSVQRISPRVISIRRTISSVAQPPTSPFRARQSAPSSKAKQQQQVVTPPPPTDFVCVTCSKRFKTRTAWRNHNLTHLGVKPFRCTWQGCDFAATVRGYVLRHIRTKHLLVGAVKIEQGQEQPPSVNPQDYVAVDENIIQNIQ